MDDLQKQLYNNSLAYKRSLDRIIDKYSKLQYQDGGVDVDLNNTKPQTLELYMTQSKTQLDTLESKSLTDLRDESLKVPDMTRDSQLDFTYEDGEADEASVASVSTTQLSVEDDGMSTSDMTKLSVNSLDESQRNLSELELQPEDQDEELEMTLRSHGSSFVELYPSMISRIERARHRQHVSEAADLVLRRYRRWRQQSNKSSLNKTFIVTLRDTNSNLKKVTSKTLREENSVSPVKSHFMRTETTPLSPLHRVTNLQDWQAKQQSPERVRGSLGRTHQPVLVMDISSSDTSETKELPLNKTFTVSELGEQPSTCAVSPSRPCYPTAKAPVDLSLMSKRLDEDFIKLYHKFVCQNKPSFFNGPPCRFCARSSEASRGHSSSALAALALSPQRSVLRKRHRELSLDSHPRSKRFRDEYGTSSPGSKRHGNEMLRRYLSTSEYERSHDSPSKHSMLQRFSTQQRSADAQQETWMSRRHHRSAAAFSGLGGSLESKMANGYSPRKW